MTGPNTDIAPSNEIATIDFEKSVEVFKSGKQILLEHQRRSGLAEKSFNSVLADWAAAEKITDPELKKEALAKADARSNKILANADKAWNEMQEERKAVTQIMDTIKSLYTAEELKVSKKAALQIQIQTRRNVYAKWLIDEQKRIDAEAEAKANKTKEAIDIKASFSKTINAWLLNLLAEKKTKMTVGFNNITLLDYDKKKELLTNAVTTFPNEKLKDLVLSLPGYRYHTQKEVEEIRDKTREDHDFYSFFSEYASQVIDLQKSLIDRLPSKKVELEEAEKVRKQAEDDQKKREEEIRKTKDKEKQDQLKKEAELEKQKQKDAAQKLAEEKQQREKDEENRQRLQAEELQQQSNEKVEIAASGEHAETLFTQTLESTPVTPPPAARVGYSIKVTHPAGWIEMITLWYNKSGKTETLDELDKKTFKQVKTFCEKLANGKDGKPGEKIESKFLVYEEEVKVINKKEKENADNRKLTNILTIAN